MLQPSRNPRHSMEQESRPWHHRPAHLFLPGTMYIVTAGTVRKKAFFAEPERRVLLQEALFEVAAAYGWRLEAWAVFSNHYHFIGQSPEDAGTLKNMLQRLHSQTARAANRQDGVKGRQVWFQFWDTCLTYEKSYYARLNYVNNNPVKHGLVPVAENYPFCSASWFENGAEPSYCRKVQSFRYDRLKIEDDF